ncbi:MAG: F0F1 ATP synthase subunit delta [Sphingorhabdus sp.]
MDNSSGNQANVQASLAGRYATALFELARESAVIDTVEASLARVQAAIADSADFASLTTNASVSRDDAKKAVAGIAKAMKIDTLTAKMLGVLAENRRLAETGAVAKAFAALAAAHRGKLTAEVTSAHGLTPAQTKALAAKLKDRVGRDVAISAKIDPSILGGMTVKIGSTLIDNSIKTRLNTLANAMKG